MGDKATIKRLKLSKFKLHTLLEITQAINDNLPIDRLLKTYEKILRKDLNIGKILIYKYNEEWECILVAGFDLNKEECQGIEKELLKYEEITFHTESDNSLVAAFDIIIPVINKNKPLAFVLIGDIDEEAEGVSPTIKHLHFIQTLSNIILVAIENIRLYQENLRQEAIKKELELASKMQTMLIPDKKMLPKNDKVYVSSFYLPHLEVGGDYYDFISLAENEIGFCIADVSGKGISAAILMSNFQANLRALFTHEISLRVLVEKLNERVNASANGEKFITLFIAKYNYQTRELEYINAGHNPPVMYHLRGKKLDFLKAGCVGMGMLEKIPVIERGYMKLNEPAKLFCYTDGLAELRDHKGEEFGMEKIGHFISNSERIDKNIEQVIKDQKILEGNPGLFDDISIIGIEFF